MSGDHLMTDDAKLVSALLRSGRAESAWSVARMAGVDVEYTKQALARMADHIPTSPDDFGWPVLRRFDLGPDVYEAVEDSAREWRGAR
jgi:hypothetical protein